MLKLDLRNELCDGLLEALVLPGPDPVLGPHQQGAVQLALSRAEKWKLIIQSRNVSFQFFEFFDNLRVSLLTSLARVFREMFGQFS